VYGAGKSDCAGQGACGADSGLGLVAAEVFAGPGDEIRTLSANDSASALVEIVDGAGVVAGLGVANGLVSAGAGPGFDEKGLENGLELADTLLVNDVAPNRLAPRSVFGLGGALGLGSGSASFTGLHCSWMLSNVTLRIER